MSNISHNLDIVDRHIRGEAQDVDSVLDLYTDDVVLSIPARGIELHGKTNIRAMYLRLFGSMRDVELHPLDRFATEDRVVDDMRVFLTVVGDGIENCPVAPGCRAELRLIHHFQMRDGLIAREEVFEVWKTL
jgi:hypothetical protein